MSSPNTNPLSSLQLRTVLTKAPSVLSLSEFRRLIDAIKDKRFRNDVLVAALSALRRGEEFGKHAITAEVRFQ